MLKYQDNPPFLSPTVSSLAELSGRWWVAHTKSRFEKAFSWDMLRKDIGYFLPMRNKVTIYRGRKLKLLIPLFSSYVFICGCEQDRYSALTTHRLCQMIEVADQEKLIHELIQIEKALTGNVPLDSYPNLPTGTRCRVKSGALAGIEGILIARQPAARFVLEVSILGQGTVMELDGDILEPLE